MNILLINYEYPPIGAGAANASFNIASRLTGLGHHVTVITSSYRNYKGHVIENGVNVYRLRTIRMKADRSNVMEMIIFVLAAYFNLKSICKKQSIESALIFFTIPCGILGFRLRKQNIPYIISLRGGDVPFHQKELNRFHKILKPVRQKILKYATHIVANSESFAKLSMQTDPFPVTVVPNGVDTDFFKPTADEQTDGLFHILFVGRFQPEKNIFFLLKEIALLKSRLTEEKVEQGFLLHLVGDGPLQTQIVSETARLGLANEIKFHGWLNKEELKTMYNSCHCLINPSLGEGMPNVVLEAMSCGLPVIASNVRGNDAVVKHNETGLLFELNDKIGLQTALCLLIGNPKTRLQFSVNSRKFAEEKHSWEQCAGEYLKLLHEHHLYGSCNNRYICK